MRSTAPSKSFETFSSTRGNCPWGEHAQKAECGGSTPNAETSVTGEEDLEDLEERTSDQKEAGHDKCTCTMHSKETNAEASLGTGSESPSREEHWLLQRRSVPVGLTTQRPAKEMAGSDK